MRKPRILFVSEFSQLNTGYAVYTREILSRLYASNRFDIAELACYYNPMNPGAERVNNVPWTVYPNDPVKSDEKEVQAFNSDYQNQFGKWRFDRVCIDFKPDFTQAISDIWMMNYQLKSPFRDFMKILWMPPVDGDPQEPSWIVDYCEADAIFGYTDWGLDLIRKQSGGKANIIGRASPAANQQHYFPIEEKQKHKASFGVPEDSFIIGTVMRNQKRKLFDALFKSFRQILDKLPPEQAEKTFLYCHTSYPDVGWNLPRLLAEHKVSNKVLFTYVCRQTGYVYPSFFKGARSISPKTQQPTSQMPNTEHGVDSNVLGAIMNCFDIYVQYAICVEENTEVCTDKGWKRIKDIKDEEVLTHKSRYRPVLSKRENRVGSVMEITVEGNHKPLVCSMEHPIYVYDDGFRFVEAQEVKLGDFVVIPKDTQETDVLEVDCSSYASVDDHVTTTHIKLRRGHLYDRFITVDEDFCWLLGAYSLAGVCSKSAINYIVNRTKLDEIERITTIAREKMGKTPKWYEYSTLCDRGGVSSKFIGMMFLEWFLNIYDRKIPLWIQKLPLDKQRHFIQGVLDVSGEDVEGGKSLICKSPYFVEGLRDILIRMGIHFKTEHSYNYRSRMVYKVTVYDQEHPESCKYVDGYCVQRVERSIQVNKTHDVYDIEVQEDHSFVTRIAATHNCEGLGMPQIEAASCGIPIFSVDYSGMQEAAEKTSGFKVPVKAFYRESESHRYMACPDNETFIKMVCEYISKPNMYRHSVVKKVLKETYTNYDWDKATSVWMEYILNQGYYDHEYTWNSPPRIFQPNLDSPQGYSNEQAVNWAIDNILGLSSKKNTYWAAKLVRDLDYGARFVGNGFNIEDASVLGSRGFWSDYGQYEMFNELYQMRKHINQMEQIRCGIIKDAPYFITHKKLDVRNNMEMSGVYR